MAPLNVKTSTTKFHIWHINNYNFFIGTMKTGSSFLDRLIDRMDRLDPSSLQSYVLRLVRQKGFMETIFNTIQEGVIVIDRNLKIRYINVAAQNLLSIPDEESAQRIDRYLRDVDWSALLEADPEHWHRISRQEIEVYYPHPRFLSFYLVPMRSESEEDEIPMATLILRDVTQAQRDQETTIESQKVQAITMLAAGVAHELGNPLNSLNIHLQLFSRQLNRVSDPELAAELKDYLEVAQNEVNRLDAILHNFLRAVRPKPLEVQKLKVENLLAETLNFMRSEIEDRNILVQASWPENLPYLAVDPDQIKQAFFNIIKNAVQAMPEGGILQIGCRATDTFLEIRFADTGKGISTGDMSRITEPYFTTKADGSGLGLLIVERVVRSHGGELGIESGEKQGAVVTIRLPLRERKIRLLEAAKPAENQQDSVS